MTEDEYVRLANRYLNDIYRIAYSGCRNQQDAEDVVQEAFEAMLHRTEAFESDEHVKRWLIRVAVNKCRSLWRSPWKTRVNLSEDIPAVGPVWQDEDQEELYRALRNLPPKYAQTLHLYYFEDLSTREIAGVMGITETAVSTRLQRAREKVRVFLEGGNV